MRHWFYNWWRSFKGKQMAESLNLKTIQDTRGSLTVLEKLPFSIKRVYYLHGVDISAMRGGHAHRNLERIMVAVSGSFKVKVRNKRWSEFVLNDPTVGLAIHPLEWVEVNEFTPDAVCLVLASEEHDEKDAIREFDAYMRLSKPQSSCDCNQGRLDCSCERSVCLA